MKQRNAPERMNFSVLRPKPRASKEVPRLTLSLLAFDPGGTTGWSLMTLPVKINGLSTLEELDFRALLNQSKRYGWSHGQIDCSDEEFGIWQIGKILDQWSHAAIITEQFILMSGRSEKSATLLTPERLNSHIKYMMWRLAKPVFQQTAGMVKAPINDARLKVYECYTSEGGLEHARDADRHLLFYLKRVMGKDIKARRMRAKAWPHIYNEKGDLLE